MSEVQDFNDTDEVQGDDSAIINDLRKQVRKLEKSDKEKTEQLAEVEALNQSKRDEAARQIVDTIGLPALKEDVLNWVEGDVTQESVVEALQARGIPLSDTPVQPPQDAPTQPPVSEIGQRVADAAAGGAVKDLDSRIAEAQNDDELLAIMQEADLTRSHS